MVEDDWNEDSYDDLDWGGDIEKTSDEEYVHVSGNLYPATNKPNQAAICLIICGFILLATAMTMNGILNDTEKVEGISVKYNESMNQMGISLEGEDIDRSFVRQILEFGMMWEVICAILSFAGGILLILRQSYNLVLVGCAAAILGLGGLFLSTLLGAFALYLTFQCRPEFGITEHDESW